MDNNPRLSFREVALVHLLGNGYEVGAAISQAEDAATKACARWGHHYDLDPKFYKATCHRCGTKTTGPR